MHMKAPKSPRETFDSFRFYEREAGLDAFVGKWDLAGVTPHQVYYSILNRLPEPKQAACWEGYDAAAQYINALRGAEFQNGVVSAILKAYPDKKRLIFVHIPKCAGSHLNTKLISAFATLNFRMMDRNWMKTETLFHELKILAGKLENSDSIAPYGHLILQWYLDHKLIRFGDFAFSIIRNPSDMVLSQINYILTRFANDPELRALDTQAWAQYIQRPTLSAFLASKQGRELGLEILFNDRLVPRNLICRFLGRGDAQSAFELCATAAIELTDIEHYKEWLPMRLGLKVGEPSNVSTPYVTMDSLGADGFARVNSLIEQDTLLVDKVRQVLSKTNRCYVSGPELL